MVDPPVLDAVLTAIFESDQYIPHPISLELAPRSTFPIKRLIVRGTVCCRYILGNGLTSGGDFNIPGSVEYQCVASPNSQLTACPLHPRNHRNALWPSLPLTLRDR